MSIKKKIGGALITTALGASLIGAGTFALFTGSAQNTGNTFATGKVEISDHTATAGTAVTVTGLAPGDSVDAKVTVKNTGSLNEWVAISDYSFTGDLGPALTSTFDENLDNNIVLLKPTETYEFTIPVQLPIGTDNTYADKTGGLTVNVKSVQAKNNGDTDNNGVKDAGEAPVSW